MAFGGRDGSLPLIYNVCPICQSMLCVDFVQKLVDFPCFLVSSVYRCLQVLVSYFRPLVRTPIPVFSCVIESDVDF